MRKTRYKTIMILSMLLILLICSLDVSAKKTFVKRMPLKKLQIGKEIQLKASASSKTIWKSSDQSIAEVRADGTVKAKKAGKAVVTAKVQNKKWKWEIQVKPYSLMQMKSIINQYFKTHKEWRENYVAMDFTPYKKKNKYYYGIRTKNSSGAANALVGVMVVNQKTGKGVLECSYPYTGTYRFNFL